MPDPLAYHEILVGALGLVGGGAVEEVAPDVGEDEPAAGGGFAKQGEGVPHGVLGEVLGDRLPHEHGRPVEAEPVGGQRLCHIIGLEVHRHQPDVLGNRAKGGADPAAFGVDVGRQVDLVHPRRVGEAVGTGVQAGAEHHKLVDTRLEGGPDLVVGVALAAEHAAPDPECFAVGRADQLVRHQLQRAARTMSAIAGQEPDREHVVHDPAVNRLECSTPVITIGPSAVCAAGGGGPWLPPSITASCVP